MCTSTFAAVFLAIFLVNYCQSETIILASPGSRYTVEMTLTRSPQFSVKNCQVHDARSPLIRRARTKVMAVNDAVMDIAVKNCEDNNKTTTTNSTKSDSTEKPENNKQYWWLEYPGTKWCGPGNTANGYEDLGEKKAMDMCCRDHDHCPQFISVGEKKYGLFNNGYATISHCSCDQKFRHCLTNAGGTAITLADFYFNVFKMQCFKKDYPISRCLRKTGFFTETCQQYELDTTKPKIYQIFDNPDF